MRWAVGIVFFAASVVAWSQQMEVVRQQFHTIDNEDGLLAFIALMGDVKDTKATPYKEAANMRMAEYTANPLKKLKYFKDGKKQLELYISQNPNDIEARYVRALIQSEVPGFLNYNEQFNSDASFVLEHIDTSGLTSAYKDTIKKTINQLVKKHQL